MKNEISIFSKGQGKNEKEGLIIRTGIWLARKVQNFKAESW